MTSISDLKKTLSETNDPVTRLELTRQMSEIKQKIRSSKRESPDTSSEVWRAVPGHEDSYEVSDLGRVRGLDRQTAHQHVYRGKILALWKGHKNSGWKVVLYEEGGRRHHLVARLVLEAFKGPPPQKPARPIYLNGDIHDVRLSNLEWGEHPKREQMFIMRCQLADTRAELARLQALIARAA